MSAIALQLDRALHDMWLTKVHETCDLGCCMPFALHPAHNSSCKYTSTAWAAHLDRACVPLWIRTAWKISLSAVLICMHQAQAWTEHNPTKLQAGYG